MFLQSVSKLNNSISVQNFAPIFRWRLKKKRSSQYSGSISARNFRFLVAKWVLLAKKQRRPVSDPRGHRPPPPPGSPKIDAYAGNNFKGTIISNIWYFLQFIKLCCSVINCQLKALVKPETTHKTVHLCKLTNCKSSFCRIYRINFPMGACQNSIGNSVNAALFYLPNSVSKNSN